MRHIISVLVENEAGALSRLVGLFSQRGYNIETLNVAPTEDPTLSRLTLTPCHLTGAALSYLHFFTLPVRPCFRRHVRADSRSCMHASRASLIHHNVGACPASDTSGAGQAALALCGHEIAAASNYIFSTQYFTS